ncbi:hypothetical protein ACOSQ3_025056 [Xanthoceras sorbifolium]
MYCEVKGHRFGTRRMSSYILISCCGICFCNQYQGCQVALLLIEFFNRPLPHDPFTADFSIWLAGTTVENSTAFCTLKTSISPFHVKISVLE